MKKTRSNVMGRTAALGGLLMVTVAGCDGAVTDEIGSTSEEIEVSGGTSSDPSYFVPVMAGVSFQPLLTVGDSPALDDYPMVGIPDGMGAYRNGRRAKLIMNHELVGTAGAVRDHGAKGAFLSLWTIDRKTGQVLAGEDLIQNVVTWNTATSSYNAPAKGVVLNRLCSGDLPDQSAIYNRHSRNGFKGRLYFAGEESGFGRAFATDVESGIAYDLPRLGKISWENALARPDSGVKTVVANLDDTTPGEVYVYVGTKTKTGSPVARAGLTNGSLFGIKVVGYPAEPATGIPSGTAFTVYEFGDVSNTSGPVLQETGSANGVTAFLRPEDGHWNPTNPDEFYFVTTASFTTSTRLWRLNFADATNPAAGGTIDLLIDGATTSVGGVTPKMFDNITVTNDGEFVYMQEDPGNQAHLGKIWRYDIDTGALELVAQFDPARFVTGGASFMTQDEESSGIIDASEVLGKGKFFINAQVHKAHPDTSLVEYGQLLIMTVASNGDDDEDDGDNDDDDEDEGDDD